MSLPDPQVLEDVGIHCPIFVRGEPTAAFSTDCLHSGAGFPEFLPRYRHRNSPAASFRKNTLFESLIGRLLDYPELRRMLDKAYQSGFYEEPYRKRRAD